jgi:hypothetical protein
MKMAIQFQKKALSAGADGGLVLSSMGLLCFRAWIVVLSDMFTIVLSDMRVAVDLYQTSVGVCLKVCFKGCYKRLNKREIFLFIFFLTSIVQDITEKRCQTINKAAEN